MAKGMELIPKCVQWLRLAERRAQTPGDPRAEVGFGARCRDVQPAVDQSVDPRTDDFGAVDHFSVLDADVGREPVQVHDLAIEKDHGDFGPGFLVYGRAATAGFREQTYGARSGSFLRHGVRRGHRLV